MKRSHRLSLLLAGACGLLAGLAPRHWILEPAAAQPAPADRDLSCRIFSLDLPAGDRSSLVETADETEEIGQWVASLRASGWTMEGSDFEVGQNLAGYPRGWMQLCLSRPR